MSWSDLAFMMAKRQHNQCPASYVSQLMDMLVHKQLKPTWEEALSVLCMSSGLSSNVSTHREAAGRVTAQPQKMSAALATSCLTDLMDMKTANNVNLFVDASVVGADGQPQISDEVRAAAVAAATAKAGETDDEGTMTPWPRAATSSLLYSMMWGNHFLAKHPDRHKILEKVMSDCPMADVLHVLNTLYVVGYNNIHHFEHLIRQRFLSYQGWQIQDLLSLIKLANTPGFGKWMQIATSDTLVAWNIRRPFQLSEMKPVCAYFSSLHLSRFGASKADHFLADNLLAEVEMEIGNGIVPGSRNVNATREEIQTLEERYCFHIITIAEFSSLSAPSPLIASAMLRCKSQLTSKTMSVIAGNRLFGDFGLRSGLDFLCLPQANDRDKKNVVARIVGNADVARKLSPQLILALNHGVGHIMSSSPEALLVREQRMIEKHAGQRFKVTVNDEGIVNILTYCNRLLSRTNPSVSLDIMGRVVEVVCYAIAHSDRDDFLGRGLTVPRELAQFVDNLINVCQPTHQMAQYMRYSVACWSVAYAIEVNGGRMGCDEALMTRATELRCLYEKEFQQYSLQQDGGGVGKLFTNTIKRSIFPISAVTCLLAISCKFGRPMDEFHQLNIAPPVWATATGEWKPLWNVHPQPGLVIDVETMPLFAHAALVNSILTTILDCREGKTSFSREIADRDDSADRYSHIFLETEGLFGEVRQSHGSPPALIYLVDALLARSVEVTETVEPLSMREDRRAQIIDELEPLLTTIDCCAISGQWGSHRDLARGLIKWITYVADFSTRKGHDLICRTLLACSKDQLIRREDIGPLVDHCFYELLPKREDDMTRVMSRINSWNQGVMLGNVIQCVEMCNFPALRTFTDEFMKLPFATQHLAVSKIAFDRLAHMEPVVQRLVQQHLKIVHTSTSGAEDNNNNGKRAAASFDLGSVGELGSLALRLDVILPTFTHYMEQWLLRNGDGSWTEAAKKSLDAGDIVRISSIIRKCEDDGFPLQEEYVRAYVAHLKTKAESKDPRFTTSIWARNFTNISHSAVATFEDKVFLTDVVMERHAVEAEAPATGTLANSSGGAPPRKGVKKGHRNWDGVTSSVFILQKFFETNSADLIIKDKALCARLKGHLERLLVPVVQGGVNASIYHTALALLWCCAIAPQDLLLQLPMQSTLQALDLVAELLEYGPVDDIYGDTKTQKKLFAFMEIVQRLENDPKLTSAEQHYVENILTHHLFRTMSVTDASNCGELDFTGCYTGLQEATV